MYFTLMELIVNTFIIESKSRSSILEKSSRSIPRSESKESKNLTLYKAAPIRETKTSRLRAASIISPNGMLHLLISTEYIFCL